MPAVRCSQERKFPNNLEFLNGKQNGVVPYELGRSFPKLARQKKTVDLNIAFIKAKNPKIFGIQKPQKTYDRNLFG